MTGDPTLHSIRSRGGLLPPTLLEALAATPEQLPGSDPASFGLVRGRTVADEVGEAWTRLVGRWERFTEREGGPDTARSERWVLDLLGELAWQGLSEVAPHAEDASSTSADGAFTHEWGSSVPIAVVPWDTSLDRRTSGRAVAPHSALQSFLNRSEPHLWGIVTNGRTVRLLRDSRALTRQAFLEIDLESLFSARSFSDFRVAWWLLHSSRFEPRPGPAECWLERWQQHSSELGIRALEGLREGVRTAVEEIGTGLLTHGSNADLRKRLREGDVDAVMLHHQVLRLVYQMIFVMVLEASERLHAPNANREVRARYDDHYSLRALARDARRHQGGRHPDAWERLRTLLDGLSSDEGVEELGLPSLASGLFDPVGTGLLGGTQLSNRDLFAAVRALTEVVRDGRPAPVDYRHLGAEELGSVYESILELVPELDTEARTLRLSENPENERRATGAFYTPPPLIAEILDHALDPVIADAIAGKDPAAAAEAILDLTVLDPACGSGHFLVGAAHRLAQHLAGVREDGGEPSPPAVQQALRDVVSRCLYGVDVNPMAVELAKISLWMEAHVPGQPLTFLDHHLVAGDSLTGAWSDDIATGIPDAAFKAHAGDDAKLVRAWQRLNRERRSGQTTLLSATGSIGLEQARSAARVIDESEDRTVDDVRRKAEAARRVREDASVQRAIAIADAWCASFTGERSGASGSDPVEAFYTLRDTDDAGQQDRRIGDRDYLHWELTFPARVGPGSGMFDVVVGNPPYLRGRDHAQLDPRGRHLQSIRYAACSGSQWNLYVPFILLAARLARKRSALLVQSSILGSQYAAAVHRELLDDYGVTACLDFSQVPGLFSGAAVQVACLVITREPASSTRFVRYGDGLIRLESVEVSRDELERLPAGYWTLPASGLDEDLRDFFLTRGMRLGDVAEIRDGMEQQAAYDAVPLVREEEPGERDALRLLPTGLIDPFRSRWGEQQVSFLKSKFHRPVLRLSDLRANGFEAMAEQGQSEKVCIAGMGSRIEAFVDEGRHLVSKSAFALRLSDPEICPYAVAAFLNSEVANRIYSAAFAALGFGAGSFNYRPGPLGELPLPPREALSRAKGPDDRSARLSAMGKRLQSELESSDSHGPSQAELDVLVRDILRGIDPAGA